MGSSVLVRRLDAQETRAHVMQLAAILRDCVEDGASVGFLLPFPQEEAEAFYAAVANEVAADRIVLLAAFVGDNLMGSVQLAPVAKANQPHRAEVAKLLVHRRGRRRGVALALMTALETEARQLDRWLLCLDTTAGSDAERLYDRLAWTRLGVMPNHALWPDGRFSDTTFFYKRI